MRSRARLAMALILLVGLLWAGLPLPVLAQGGTVLSVDPAAASVEVDGQREIQLFVSGAESLNAFDVQVEYDSELLTLVRWEFGGLLSNLAVVKRDDLPGSFRLVATQLATPGVSGDGVLLRLFFSGKKTGSSPIDITRAEFARSEGGLSLPERRGGTMTVIPAQPTATPTRTPTATATATATLTATMPPSATATTRSSLTPTATRTATASATPAGGGADQATQAPTGGTRTPSAPIGGTDAPKPTDGQNGADSTEGGTGTGEAPGGEELGGPGAGEEPGESGGPGESGASSASGTGSGGGYVLEKARGSGPTTMGVILFIAGLLAIGAAAVITTTRKGRV